MAMKNTERQYIEYRPNLGMRADIQAIIESTTGEVENYQLPEEVAEALEKPACQVLESALETLKGVDNFIDDLEDNLRDKDSGPVPFSEYLESRKEDGDPHVAMEWEDHHSKQLDGLLIGELYPIMLNVRENLVDNIRLLNSELITGDIEHDSIDDICNQEAKELESVIRNDLKQKDPAVLEAMKVQNELTEAVSGAVEGIQTFLEDVSHLAHQTTSDLFRGDVDSVVEIFAEAGDSNLEKLQRLSEIGFHQYAEQSQDIKNRIDRVKATNDIVHHEIKELRKLKMEAGEVLGWLMEIDTDFDESPITEVIENTILSASTVLDGYDDVVADMHKTNEMQLMQFEDVVDNLYLKENQRAQYKMVNDMQQHFDHTDRDRTKQVKRFSENMGYKKAMRTRTSHRTQGLVRK